MLWIAVTLPLLPLEAVRPLLLPDRPHGHPFEAQPLGAPDASDAQGARCYALADHARVLIPDPAAFALGAEGVQMGTRFLVSVESPVHASYKEALRSARETDTVMLNRMAKPAVRALKTEVSQRVMAEGGRLPAAAFAGIQALYFQGDLASSVASAGEVVGLIDDVPTVAEIVERTVAGFRERAAALGALAVEGF